MESKFLRTFKDAEQLWLGLDTPGMTRKVFRLVTDELVGSKHLNAGVTIFEPGEKCPLHDHPGCEEIDYIIKGKALAVDKDGNTKVMNQYDMMFIPDGEPHQHISIGDEPLWLLWVYTPQTQLPK